jgi:hypothetical protein
VITGEGQGFVTYSARPATAVQTGDLVTAQASIVFDTNAPIDTPQISNTLDAGQPTSHLEVTPIQDQPSVLLNFTTHDDLNGSGVAGVDVYQSVGDGPFTLWKANILEDQAVFSAPSGQTYRLVSVAHDNAGNVETLNEASAVSVTIEQPQVGQPEPVDGAVDVPMDQPLKWQTLEAGIPADLYLWAGGDRPAQPAASGLTGSYTLPQSLAPLTTYFWQVIVHSSTGDLTSPIWTFTTQAVAAVPLPVQADFSADVLSGDAPLQVTFTNNSGGDFDTITWDFGDGANSHEANPVHFYKKGGAFTVTLTVSGPGGVNTKKCVGYIVVRQTYKKYIPLLKK